MNNKVSIIVPVYNIENHVAKCLDSLVSQTYQNLEIIVIDDGSTDYSWKIISEFKEKDSRIVSIKQQNGGAAKARNTGLDFVTGDFLMFVDGDDAISRETIEQNVQYLLKDKMLDWVTFPVYRVNEKLQRITSKRVFGQFIPIKEEIVEKQNFVSYFFNDQLSGIACAAIYQWESVKSIRFPEKEYYEDSFYFTDVLYYTHKAFISLVGAYYYLERSNSAQLTKVDSQRLFSKIHMITDRIIKFEKMNPNFFSAYQDLESSLYYYIKTEQEKGSVKESGVLDNFRSQMHYPLKRKFVIECKLWCYQLFGYDNLKKIFRK